MIEANSTKVHVAASWAMRPYTIRLIRNGVTEWLLQTLRGEQEFPHWFGNGWFVLVRKSKAELWHSCHYDARKASKIVEGPRTAATYVAFAQAMGW